MGHVNVADFYRNDEPKGAPIVESSSLALEMAESSSKGVAVLFQLQLTRKQAMATYKQIQKQIEQLQRQAEVLRNSEVKGVIDRIKVAIAHYGLTAAHLGLGAASVSPKATGKRSAKAKASAQFSDDAGNKWSGRGPRPRWLREAIAAGRSIDEFRSSSASKSTLASSMEKAQSKASTKKPAAKKTKRAPSKVNYTDGTGNSWTGRGPKPGWLKAALDGGKSLQDFAKKV